MSETWDHYAEQLDGKTVKIDGIEVRVEVTRDRRTGRYTSEVYGHPTAKGRKTEAYREQRTALGDDWSFCWGGSAGGELPEEFNALLS